MSHTCLTLSSSTRVFHSGGCTCSGICRTVARKQICLGELDILSTSTFLSAKIETTGPQGLANKVQTSGENLGSFLALPTAGVSHDSGIPLHPWSCVAFLCSPLHRVSQPHVCKTCSLLFATPHLSSFTSQFDTPMALAWPLWKNYSIIDHRAWNCEGSAGGVCNMYRST